MTNYEIKFSRDATYFHETFCNLTPVSIRFINMSHIETLRALIVMELLKGTARCLRADALEDACQFSFQVSARTPQKRNTVTRTKLDTKASNS